MEGEQQNTLPNQFDPTGQFDPTHFMWVHKSTTRKCDTFMKMMSGGLGLGRCPPAKPIMEDLAKLEMFFTFDDEDIANSPQLVIQQVDGSITVKYRDLYLAGFSAKGKTFTNDEILKSACRAFYYLLSYCVKNPGKLQDCVTYMLNRVTSTSCFAYCFVLHYFLKVNIYDHPHYITFDRTNPYLNMTVLRDPTINECHPAGIQFYVNVCRDNYGTNYSYVFANNRKYGKNFCDTVKLLMTIPEIFTGDHEYAISVEIDRFRTNRRIGAKRAVHKATSERFEPY